MMYAKKHTHVGYRADGKEVIDALIVADEMPETFPTTGDGIDQISGFQVFEPGSIIMIISDDDDNGKIYQYNGTDWCIL